MQTQQQPNSVLCAQRQSNPTMDEIFDRWRDRPYDDANIIELLRQYQIRTGRTSVTPHEADNEIRRRSLDRYERLRIAVEEYSRLIATHAERARKLAETSRMSEASKLATTIGADQLETISMELMDCVYTPKHYPHIDNRNMTVDD